MNLQRAKQAAKYKTELTKISHVVTKTNGNYDVFMKKHWNGEIIKQYDYEDIKPAKKKTKDISDVQPIASAEVLPDTGI